jgi:hypothetical protein
VTSGKRAKMLARQIGVTGDDRSIDKPEPQLRAPVGAIHQRAELDQVQSVHGTLSGRASRADNSVRNTWPHRASRASRDSICASPDQYWWCTSSSIRSRALPASAGAGVEPVMKQWPREDSSSLGRSAGVQDLDKATS